MEIFELGFAKIIRLRDDIAEVIVAQNVEMNEATVDLYHAFLIAHLRGPFSLLINKLNAYTYSFDAQMKLATITQIHAMAVVAYNRKSMLSTQSLSNDLPRETKWNLQLFSEREPALAWLIAEQEAIRKA